MCSSSPTPFWVRASGRSPSGRDCGPGTMSWLTVAPEGRRAVLAHGLDVRPDVPAAAPGCTGFDDSNAGAGPRSSPTDRCSLTAHRTDPPEPAGSALVVRV